MELTGTTAGGLAITLTARVKCEAWVIFNSEHHAYSSGRFVFNEIVVDKPANCKVTGGKFTTHVLSGEAVEVKSLPTELAVWYKPAVGTLLAEFEFEGAECAVAELVVPLSGTIAAEVEPLNVFKEIQPYRFNSTTQKDVGTKLQVGGGGATLTGVVEFHF